MVRASASKKKKREDDSDDEAPQNADAVTRKRLKKLAISAGVLSETPARARSALNPTKTVVKHHGKDILRKSQRKNRYLFSFPGLVGPLTGGKIGELKDLGTKNPILYLDFPQGQMKLFGTIIYPKNRYLTLQFSRGGKNVMCEDYFDNMIVFADAWWIGRKEENPEEARLDFPKELIEAQHVECDFQGGAGAEVATKQVNRKSETKSAVQSPKTDTEDYDEADLKELKEQTPTRHSERTAGRTFKFTEVSSGDDSINSDEDIKEEEDDNSDEGKEKVRSKISSRRILDIDNEAKAAVDLSLGQVQTSETSEAKSKHLAEVVISRSKAKEDVHSNHSSLVQSTISTLFKKVEEKMKVEENIATRSSRKSSSAKESDKKLTKMDKRNVDEVEYSLRKPKLAAGKLSGRTGTTSKKKVQEVEEDDIEEFLSSAEDIDTSDEDWET